METGWSKATNPYYTWSVLTCSSSALPSPPQAPSHPRGGAEALWLPGSPPSRAPAVSTTSTSASAASACCSVTSPWRASSSATGRRPARPSQSCVTSASLRSSRRPLRAAWTARPATVTNASSCTTPGARPKLSMSMLVPPQILGPRQVPSLPYRLFFFFFFLPKGFLSVRLWTSLGR